MKTIDELVSYCNENEPVGALLLTGEWGCGKTYLIEHELKEALSQNRAVVRVSLFGITSPNEIHGAVRSAWLDEYYKIKGIDGITERVGKGKQIISKLEFLPEWIRGIASTDVAALFPISNKIENVPVILVFDDLERCQVNYADILGVINDYCENQKYYTIIVANQEKVFSKEESNTKTAELSYSFSDPKSHTSNDGKAVLVVKDSLPVNQNVLSYSEIKEKIIHRTVQYIPDYKSIVHAVIESYQYQDDNYKMFVQECEEGILDLFAPNRLKTFSEQSSKRPHNIRSLKCAICDFYRIYTILNDNEIDNISNWFFSFIAYVIAYKANIAKEGAYGTLFSDDDVNKLYPVFDNSYIFSSVKRWILHGVWDEAELRVEIKALKDRKAAKNPVDIIRTSRIVDVDEEIIEQGLESLLNDAYAGNMTFDDYVLLIENSAWARYYGYKLPIQIDWDKIKIGIQILIDRTLEEMPETQLLFHMIGEGSKKDLSEEERDVYSIIDRFALGDEYVFIKNQKAYIAKMKEHGVKAYFALQNNRFDSFSEEMAIATAESYYRGDNSIKREHVNSYEKMWKVNIKSTDFNFGKSVAGFTKLRALLLSYQSEYNSSRKSFSELHTKRFISIVDELISECENKS